MKKFLLLFLSIWIAFACSKDKEIPNPNPPIEKPSQNENPKPVGIDSVYYQLDVDGFELVAATEDSTSLFLQTDTTFAFKCLFDSCDSNRLVAYCDSTGLVERIVADNQVVNILHHEDKKKMDIFYKDVEGKFAWIKDVDSPYKNLSSRSEAGDVPYSAISIVSDLSYAVYTIINTCDIYKVVQPEKYKFINKSSRKETYNMSGTIALKLIMQVLGKEYKMSVSNHISTIVTVMSDYANWVQQELYGDAIPVLRPYAYATGNSMSLSAYVTGVNSLKNEFKVGIMYTEAGNKLNAYNFFNKMDAEYNPQYINYLSSFSELATGKKYKFRPYLAPVSTSKYMTGLKSLLDYYQMNYSFDYRLLETKAQLISKGNDYATIKLSVENADIPIKMGVIYSEHSDLLEHEYKKMEYEPTFEEGLFSNNFETEVKLENLKPGNTYYYMPYIIYDDDVLNHNLYAKDTIVSDVITDKDQTFYGKKDSFEAVDEKSIRDLLKEIYEKNNGINWVHQKNWLTDLPVTEWEGVEKIEKKGRSADEMLYHFKFMAMNNLTGTLTIENCNEHIVIYNCDYANNNLEGLYLKNCPNLYFDKKIYQNGEDITPYWMETGIENGNCYIGTISNNLKNIYLDNITTTTINRDKNLFYKTIVICSNHSTFLNEWEKLEIKNYKDIAGIVISDCSKLKNVICENNAFYYSENYRDREYIIDNCPSLEKISFKYNTSNQEFGSIYHYISRCHNLKEVILENPNDFTSYDLEFNSSQIDLVSIKNASVYFRDHYNHFEDYEYPQIKEIYVEKDDSSNYEGFFSMYETVTQNIKLEKLRIYSSVSGNLDFHNNQTIKNIEIMDHIAAIDNGIINLNGCINLEYFTCSAGSMYDYSPTIDVRNTPKLKEFICNRARIKEILFDSHMNADDLIIDCKGLNILQELPDCYEGGGNFLYDHRYDYIRKENGEFETIDHGRGWWYPGEPESLNHGR